MAANFPIIEGQFELYLGEKGFITNLTIEACLNEMSYIKKMDMQQWVTGNLKDEFDERAKASSEDTRQKIVQLPRNLAKSTGCEPGNIHPSESATWRSVEIVP